MPAYDGGPVDFVALTLVTGWLMWNLGLVARGILAAAYLNHAAMSCAARRHASAQMLDAGTWVLTICLLPWVLGASLGVVALYVGLVAWNHYRVATRTAVLETLEGGARRRCARRSENHA
jgi:hypothetical protein